MPAFNDTASPSIFPSVIPSIILIIFFVIITASGLSMSKISRGNNILNNGDIALYFVTSMY